MGDGPHDGVAGVRAPGPPRLRHVVGRRAWRSAGRPRADELQRKVRETFPNVRSTTNAYGLTEIVSVATAISGQDAIDKPTSVGPARADGRGGHPRRERRGARCRRDGEVLITGRSSWPATGTSPRPPPTTVDDDGWLHTGDIGHLDDDGFLYITDRAKDMIIRGGENIYCVEIENRLVEHPKIADAAIIGVPHPELGEEVKAVVQVEPGEKHHRGRGAPVGGRRRSPTSRCRRTSRSAPRSCPATRRASCSRTCSGARARSASTRRCNGLSRPSGWRSCRRPRSPAPAPGGRRSPGPRRQDSR